MVPLNHRTHTCAQSFEICAKCRSHVYSRYSATRGFDKPHAGTPMSHTHYGICDVFHTTCDARLYNIPRTTYCGNSKVDERMKSDANCVCARCAPSECLNFYHWSVYVEYYVRSYRACTITCMLCYIYSKLVYALLHL